MIQDISVFHTLYLLRLDEGLLTRASTVTPRATSLDFLMSAPSDIKVIPDRDSLCVISLNFEDFWVSRDAVRWGGVAPRSDPLCVLLGPRDRNLKPESCWSVTNFRDRLKCFMNAYPFEWGQITKLTTSGNVVKVNVLRYFAQAFVEAAQRTIGPKQVHKE